MVDLPWGDERSLQFVTNVGLITSGGSAGYNIMAAEWTHHISYSPGLIMVCIRPGKATHKNISETKEFGVNLAAIDQSTLAHIAGTTSGFKTYKIIVFEELGFSFYPARTIKSFMVRGAALNAECKLVKTLNIGSHTIFIGEVLEASKNRKESLVYSKGEFWKLSDRLASPSSEERKRIQTIIEKHKK